MSYMIEAQGVTVDEAIQLALNQLGVGRDSVEIKILHHPRSGFLGIGARRAKVRATLREDALQDGAEFDMSEGRRNRRRRRRPPRHRRSGEQESTERETAARDQRGGEARRDSGRPKGRESGAGESGGRDGAKSADGEQRSGGSRGRGNRRGGRGRQGRGGRTDQSSPTNERESVAPSSQGGDRGRERNGNRGRGRDQQRAERPMRASTAPAAGEPVQQPARDAQAPLEESVAKVTPAIAAAPMPVRPQHSEPTDSDTAAEVLTLEEIRPRAEEIISEILRLMGFEAKVSARCDDAADEVVVAVEADAEGLLIGRRGQTLDAFEHLVNRSVAAREMAENRVIIDVGGYRDRRRESLLELAGRLRERALAEGRRVQVSPMSPRDRKVFQDAFDGDTEVTTRALGTGFYRRVLIVPEGADEREAAAADGDLEEPGSQPSLGEPNE